MAKTKLKNILILTKTVDTVGGVEDVVKIHYKYFKKEKYSIKVLGIKNKIRSRILQQFLIYNSNDLYLEKGIFSKTLGLEYFYRLAKEILKNEIIIVHQPFVTGLVSLYIIATFKIFYKKLFKAKIYIYHHALPSNNYFLMRLYSFLEWFILKINNEIILLKSSESKNNLDFTKYLNNRQYQICIPINIDQKNLKNNNCINYEKELISNFDEFKNSAKITALYVGRISYYKGLLNLVRVYKTYDKLPNLVIAGDGNQSKILKKEIDKLSISAKKKILFINEYISDYLKFYFLKNSNFFIFPSINRGEAYGIAQLEAIACGIPVLNTKLDTGVNVVCKHMVHGVTCKNYKSLKDLYNSIQLIVNLISKNKFKKEFLEEYVTNNYSHNIFDKQMKKVFLN